MTLQDFLFLLENGTMLALYDGKIDKLLYVGRTIIAQEDFDLSPYLNRRICAINTSPDDCDIELVLA